MLKHRSNKVSCPNYARTIMEVGKEASISSKSTRAPKKQNQNQVLERSQFNRKLPVYLQHSELAYNGVVA